MSFWRNYNFKKRSEETKKSEVENRCKNCIYSTDDKGVQDCDVEGTYGEEKFGCAKFRADLGAD